MAQEQLTNSFFFSAYFSSFSSVLPLLLVPHRTPPYLFFHRSFHHLLPRQAFLASPYPERCSAWLCKDLALCSCAAPVMQWERNVELQSITRVETKNGSVQGGMRICDLIKQHTNTLVHLCEVRLQRMMRRMEDLPHMSPACFVGTRRGRGGYTRDVVPQ